MTLEVSLSFPKAVKSTQQSKNSDSISLLPCTLAKNQGLCFYCLTNIAQLFEKTWGHLQMAKTRERINCFMTATTMFRKLFILWGKLIFFKSYCYQMLLVLKSKWTVHLKAKKAVLLFSIFVNLAENVLSLDFNQDKE
jgi:hypothetical protein